VALCYVLPIAFHAVGLGSVLSPMHIPVLLCGLVCGGGYGLLCGILGPVVSSLLSGMPPFLMLLRMVPELCVYGLVGGLCMNHIRTGKHAADLYISLAIAMILGRIAGGVASVIFYMATSGVYSFALWFTGYFVESLPGIVAHLILVPVLVFALEKSRAIPARYSKVTQE
jgi:hypothetical protein